MEFFVSRLQLKTKYLCRKTQDQTERELNLKWGKSKIPILARLLIHFYEEEKLLHLKTHIYIFLIQKKYKKKS